MKDAKSRRTPLSTTWDLPGERYGREKQSALAVWKSEGEGESSGGKKGGGADPGQPPATPPPGGTKESRRSNGRKTEKKKDEHISWEGRKIGVY